MTYNSVSEIFVGNARRLRKQRGLTQKQLEQALGWIQQDGLDNYAKRIVIHLENFEQRASVDHVVGYANYFGVSATSLLSDSGMDQYGLLYPTTVDYRKVVGQNLRRLVKEKGLTPAQFGSEMRSRGLHSYKSLNDYFFLLTSGKVSITVELLADSADVLGVSVEELLLSPERDTVYSNEVVGPNIRLFREMLGWSQLELAERVSSLGIRYSRKGIGSFETGERRIRVTPLMAFALVLGTTTVRTLLMPHAQQHGKQVTLSPPKQEDLKVTESKRAGYIEFFFDRRLGGNSKKCREKYGMSQLQLVREFKSRGLRTIDRKVLSDIENGENAPEPSRNYQGSSKAVFVDFLMAEAAVFAEREGVPPVEFAEMLLTKRL